MADDNSVLTDSAEQQVSELTSLFKQGRLEQALILGHKLASAFPDAVMVFNLLGAINGSLGRYEEAVKHLSHAIELNPDFADLHNNLGNVLVRLERYEEAVQHFFDALTLNPDLSSAYRNLSVALNDFGNSLNAQGNHNDAIVNYLKALHIAPDFADAQNNLGNALIAIGEYEEAGKCFSKAIQLRPDFAEPHSNLGIVMTEQSNLHGAIECYHRALAINPDYADGYYNLGVVYAMLEQPEDAVKHYKKSVALNPNNADTLTNLGTALKQLGAIDDAISSYRKSITIQPDYAVAHFNLANALALKGQRQEAIISHLKAIELRPEYAEAHNNLGHQLRELGQHEEALTHFLKATEIAPELVEAHKNIGITQSSMGHREQAKTALNRAIELSPSYASAHRALGKLKKFTSNDPQIEKIKALLAAAETSDQDRVELFFALAKAMADISETTQAFNYLSEGNALRKQLLNYHISTDQALFANIKSMFSENNISLSLNHGDEKPAKTPVFILGMPRSGTSLVEQILDAHSAIHGGGELMLLAESIGQSGLSLSNPLDQKQLQSIRDHFLHGLSTLFNDSNKGNQAAYVTDKMPANFRWIGLIVKAFPEAKIIHMKRDPRAVCWSIFRELLIADGNGFACDQIDLANYYALYEDLMAFWHKLYPGSILDVDYETLTENQEVITREILDFLDLDWQKSCLNFHENERAVITASSLQVREKIYTGSSDKWKVYEQHLGPLLTALKEPPTIH